jgi:CDP-diacylglycerol--glycerol-3-phosphate 3-phosphatidyltransferase
VIKERLGQRIDDWIHLGLPFLFRRPLNPNWLTVTGALVSLVAALVFAQGHFLVAGVVMLFGGSFDLIDGVVARHFGTSSSFGAFLDSSLDRFVDMALLLGLAFYYGSQGELVPQFLAEVVLVCSIMTSYAKARAELVIPHLPGGMLERGERIGLLAAGAILNIMVPVLWVLALGTAITVVQRFWAAHRGMTRFDAAVRNGAEEV